MTVIAPTGAGRQSRSSLARALLWCVAPVVGLGYQIASEIAARSLSGRTFGVDWLHHAMSVPAVWVAILLEIVGLVVWLVILSEFALAEAFSISALSYVLVIAASWLIFHESASWLQVVGGGAILVGIWAIATETGATPTRDATTFSTNENRPHS